MKHGPVDEKCQGDDLFVLKRDVPFLRYSHVDEYR